MKKLTSQELAKLQQMQAMAISAQRNGRWGEAERWYRDILTLMPQAWEAQQGLAIVLATTGRPQEAAKHFGLIVKAHPTHAPAHANYASALAESGRLEEAVTEFRRALALDSTLNGARIALAATLRKSDRAEEAVPYYKAVLDLDHTHHQAANGLALAYRDLGEIPRALEGFQFAVNLAPANADYRLNFGVTLRRHGLDQLATEQLYEAVRLQPESLDAIVLLAEVLQDQRRFDEARECLDRALQLRSDLPELKERRGYVYLDMGDSAHAQEDFEGIVGTYPDRYMAHVGLGRSLMEAGQSSEAYHSLQNVVKKFPEESEAYFYLANSHKFKADDMAIRQVEEAIHSRHWDGEAMIALNFALGKIYDDIRQWDQAFTCYAAANTSRNQHYEYDWKVEEARFDALISTFTADFFAAHQALGCTSAEPVFIVGMPRSGTTLTEQIISSHPQAIGAGEVVFWAHAETSVPYILGTQTDWPACMQEMRASHAEVIGTSYLDLLHKITGAGPAVQRITDKMPHNFMWLGLIALLFPNARIIHCKRDAMDNCLSIYFQAFSGHHPYAYALDNIGHHYRQYERLMAHWHHVLPGRILDIQYESTVADPEYWSRELISYIGLDWDDACLAPHKLERTVKTASHWQVRQPIYKTSVARWKHYEAHLEPLKAALGYDTNGRSE